MTKKIYKGEAAVKKEVKKLLNKHKWFWWMTPANGYGSSGISDFCAMRAGAFMAIETKFETNMPTALQVGYLNSVAAERGMAFVVDDKNLEWFKRWLELFDLMAERIAQKQTLSQEEGAELFNATKALTEKII